MTLRKPLNCIIIDDEDGAHLVIEYHLKGLECLKLCGNFFGAKEAMDYIYKNPVDLIFLDINMPGISGLEMLAAMTRPPLVILTTAYCEFALESYEYQVVDYLVKPIGVSRFLAAIDKVIARFQPKEINADEELLTLKVEGEYLRINPQDIDYIQSWGNYVKVFTKGHFVLASTSTCELEKKLDPSKFIRIHKSYIVALNHIQKIKGSHVYLLDEIILPIGNTHRKQLLERLK
ncbi:MULTISPECIES: LytTR family DNA-binding domain-containing protein [unclassified Chryseobacterium]|uniref:LytR/AlgR family response regulator transcription factor n=1 Tax=unclassified Chryseobacterium TaxID=2593645 RepID=UPI00226AF848|nr:MULTISPECIES: LytTR family DNA-binding domain-containing protein [unclassified Chryseobacterium]